jgi:hypothetical protein
MNGLRAQSAMRPSSVIVITPHDGSRETQVDLVACVHCGRHWPLGKALTDHAAGRVQFGYCGRCHGITCPGERCAKCVPAEQQLENLEAGVDVLHQPLRVSFAGLPVIGQRRAA